MGTAAMHHFYWPLHHMYLPLYGNYCCVPLLLTIAPLVPSLVLQELLLFTTFTDHCTTSAFPCTMGPAALYHFYWPLDHWSLVLWGLLPDHYTTVAVPCDSNLSKLSPRSSMDLETVWLFVRVVVENVMQLPTISVMLFFPRTRKLVHDAEASFAIPKEKMII